MKNSVSFIVSYSKDGKHFAVAQCFSVYLNLHHAFFEKHPQLGEIEFINYMPSKKKALEAAAEWNECYKQNGTLLQL